ncbi:MAG: ImmA/IrrE family metallo-endopeptidase [Christensenellaceae bacterium]|nr:ImmA/IrrE family metallo-endopeptidase [Christensenellaceae bacterium]
MFYLDYDLPQLIRIAEDKLRSFDEERLKTPKPLDAFDFIEFESGLNLQTDPQRLTPNLSIWGLTAFNDGHWWIWPEGEDMPQKHPVKKGTVLIDERLLLSDASIGWRNFTVLHEGFHWVLHPRVFKRQEVVYQRHTSRDSVSARIGNKKPMLSGIQITEWQANAATAAFLMPREAVTFAFREVLQVPSTKTLPMQWTLPIDVKISEIADMFSASYSAMKYRLSDLGLLTGIPCCSDFTEFI